MYRVEARWQILAAAVLGGLTGMLVLVTLQLGGVDLPSLVFGQSQNQSALKDAVANSAADPISSRSQRPRAQVRFKTAEWRYRGAGALAWARQEVYDADIDDAARRNALAHIMAADSLLRGASGLTDNSAAH